MSCFFHALDNDPSYQGILLDNSGIYYLWYPNMQSQSRVDPNYSYMLSGYTMDGSVNILRYMRDFENNGIAWTDSVAQQYHDKLLNFTMYSFFTFLSFVRHVAMTDYIPEVADWEVLRDACGTLRDMLKEQFSQYSYTTKIEEYFRVKNMSDVLFTEPWLSFDEYIVDGCPELEWSYEKLLESKENISKEGACL